MSAKTGVASVRRWRVATNDAGQRAVVGTDSAGRFFVVTTPAGAIPRANDAVVFDVFTSRRAWNDEPGECMESFAGHWDEDKANRTSFPGIDGDASPNPSRGPSASFWRGCDRYACCGTYPGECEHPIHDAACRKASYDPDAVCECAGCKRERAWASSRAQSVPACDGTGMTCKCKCHMCRQEIHRQHLKGRTTRAQQRVVRPNPALILVTGNPAPGAVEKAWCKFHQRDVYDGRSESFGIIRGMPPFVFALGKCKSIEIDGAARPFTPQPWLVCSPDDESLWIVTKDVMNLGSGAAGKAIEAITYDPPRESGKTPAYYRHEFDKPLPVLTPVGDPHRCRAVLLDGGAYSVSDWIHE